MNLIKDGYIQQPITLQIDKDFGTLFNWVTYDRGYFYKNKTNEQIAEELEITYKGYKFVPVSSEEDRLEYDTNVTKEFILENNKETFDYIREKLKNPPVIDLELTFNKQVDAKCNDCGHIMPATELERENGHICPTCKNNSWVIMGD